MNAILGGPMLDDDTVRRATEILDGRSDPLFHAKDLPDFFAHGKCLDADPETFFPPKGAGNQPAEAKRICGECEVRSECLEWSLDPLQPYGIFGGMTAPERLNEAQRRGLR